MKISRLEPFYYVARHGGYTAAARAMPYAVGEPAVYQQIRRLEQEVGTRLVDRHGGKRVSLTPAGRMLYEFVAPWIEGLGGIERRLALHRRGTVVVAAPRVVLFDYVAPRLAGIDVSVRLVERNDPVEVASAVESGEADLGLSHFERVPAGLSRKRVGAFEAAAVVPASFRGRPDLRTLASMRFIAYERGALPRRILDETFRKEKIAFQPAFEAPTLDLILRLVAMKLGVSIVPLLRGATRAPRGVRVVPMPDLFPPRAIDLVWRGRSIPALEAVRRALA
jgi:DNA-binding transcriptional LysR family regulator